jgi:hypothetical protein
VVVSVHISEKFWSLQSLSLCQYFWLDFSNDFWRVRRNEATLANKQIWYGKHCTQFPPPWFQCPESLFILLYYCTAIIVLFCGESGDDDFQLCLMVDSRIPGSSVSWWSIARSFKLFARVSGSQVVLCNKINLEVGCRRGAQWRSNSIVQPLSCSPCKGLFPSGCCDHSYTLCYDHSSELESHCHRACRDSHIP